MAKLEKYSTKHILISAVGLIGIAFFIKAGVDLFNNWAKMGFSNSISRFTYGDMLTYVALLVGSFIIIYKIRTNKPSRDQAEENRRQLFFKMIMILMILAAALSNSIKDLQVVIYTVKTSVLVNMGVVFLFVYMLARRKYY